MQRRDFIATSLGAIAGTAIGRPATGRPRAALSPAEDEAAARRHDKERRFIETPFGRTAYIDRGSGPVLLFLHGFPLSSFQWRGAIDRLSADRRCLAPDLMGLGHTQVASGQSLVPAEQVAMLATMLDRLAIPQVDLIANDSGGAVAQLFITKHPERSRTLLLTNCDVEIDSPPAALRPVIELARSGVYPDLWLEPWVQHKSEARSPTGLGGMCYSDPSHPTDAALEQYLRPLVASAERKALVNRYTLSLEENPLRGIEPLLRESQVPTRIVWGMEDTIFSFRDAEYLAGLLPHDVGVRRLQGARLFWPEEYPDVIAEEARALWNHAGKAS